MISEELLKQLRGAIKLGLLTPVIHIRQLIGGGKAGESELLQQLLGNHLSFNTETMDFLDSSFSSSEVLSLSAVVPTNPSCCAINRGGW
jgi:hypothetical protein